jgi:hypothetical protein
LNLQEPSLTPDGIIACLLSGREPAEWVEQQERHSHSRDGGLLDSLATVDTSGYTLYRVRRLGRALAVLGARLLRSVRTRDAMNYRLRQDPLGPVMLAEALLHQWETDNPQDATNGEQVAPLVFSLTEIRLTIAHVAQRVETERHDGDPDLRSLFQEALKHIEALGSSLPGAIEETAANLRDYIVAVRQECQRLVGITTGGESHAR